MCTNRFHGAFAIGLLFALSFAADAANGGNRLVVHEWGTFTSLQNDQGEELAGINIDDEPVPKFVHNLSPYLLSKPVLSGLHWQYRQKGAPRQHPLVTMRLETPVIYFYPPKGLREPLRLDVAVQFRGGWLTEFYPKAQASVPEIEDRIFDFGKLTPQTVGSLRWNDLQVGTEGKGPETTEQVWLAPRRVAAAGLTSVEGESEKYIFYRGVGNLHAPLRATLDRKAGELQLRGNFSETLSSGQKATVPALWLVEVRADGQCAFRTLSGFHVTSDREQVLATSSFRFDSRDFGAGNRAVLETAMHSALTADGLYSDEATALLSTWQRSYFVSPGLRVFYLVPRAWTDHHLPLSITGDPPTTRVMIGRLELISDQQRKLLDRLAASTISDGRWVGEIPESPAREQFLAGRSDFGNLGVPIPADYQLYLQMGRFRNALVASEERRRPTPSLTQFIDTYNLHPFRVPREGVKP